MAAENGQQRVVERQRGGAQLIRRQPAGHLYREGDQQHHVTDHRRVERVLPEAAVQLLGDDDGEEGTDNDHPPRGQRRQADAEQQGGQQSGVICQPAAHRQLA